MLIFIFWEDARQTGGWTDRHRSAYA